MLLQKPHSNKISELLGEQDNLPDFFSHDLAIPDTGTPEARLEALALRHRFLSDASVNWLGTYHHAAGTWLKGPKMTVGPA